MGIQISMKDIQAINRQTVRGKQNYSYGLGDDGRQLGPEFDGYPPVYSKGRTTNPTNTTRKIT